MFFSLHGMSIVDEGYLLEDGLLFLPEILLIGCFLRLQLLRLLCKSALELFLGLCQALFCPHLLFLFVSKHLFFLS
jgi:hypothetical protein